MLGIMSLLRYQGWENSSTNQADTAHHHQSLFPLSSISGADLGSRQTDHQPLLAHHCPEWNWKERGGLSTQAALSKAGTHPLAVVGDKPTLVQSSCWKQRGNTCVRGYHNLLRLGLRPAGLMQGEQRCPHSFTQDRCVGPASQCQDQRTQNRIEQCYG